MQLRTYARLVTMASVVASVAGALGWSALGRGSVLLYLLSAGVFAYAGSRRVDAGFTRAVVGGFGVLYLGAGLILAAMFVAFEFPFEGRAYAETLGLATLGGVSILCARMLPCDDDSPADGPPREH